MTDPLISMKEVSVAVLVTDSVSVKESIMFYEFNESTLSIIKKKLRHDLALFHSKKKLIN